MDEGTPLREMERMRKMMDRMFLNFWDTYTPMIESRSPTEIEKQERFRLARANMHETESGMVASFELPGVSKEDIQLDIHDNHAEVKVEKKQENKNNDKVAPSYEMQSFNFHGQLHFPKPIDPSKATASYKDGILRIEAPKRQIDGTRRLQIK